MNCCLSWPEPTDYVSIGGSIADMDCDEVRVFTIDDYNPACEESHYKWFYTPETGTLVATPPYCATYTAPPAGLDCVSPVRISLECDDEEVDAIIIAIKLEPVTASIDHTTLQMAIDEEHTLNVVPGTSGCGTPVYDWAITAGGGTLSASSGDSVVYTAPHTNPECASNPTITLSCDGVELDTIKIAVNAYALTFDAYQTCCSVSQGAGSFPDAQYQQRCVYTFNCIGGSRDTTENGICLTKCGEIHSYFDSTTYCKEDSVKVPSWFHDVRNQAMKDGGCCPEALLI